MAKQAGDGEASVLRRIAGLSRASVGGWGQMGGGRGNGGGEEGEMEREKESKEGEMILIGRAHCHVN